MTEKGLKLIKTYEGCRLKAYKCPAGVWTIGYGHTKGVRPGDVWTKEQAEDTLAKDLAEYESKVRDLVVVNITPDQLSALTSLAYNIGVDAFRKSTLRSFINNMRGEGAIRYQWKRWSYANHEYMPGLNARRRAELELYFGEEEQNILR